MHGLASALGLLAIPRAPNDIPRGMHGSDEEDEEELDNLGHAHIRVLRPSPATEEDLLSFHDAELVKRLLSDRDATSDDSVLGLEDVRFSSVPLYWLDIL